MSNPSADQKRLASCPECGSPAPLHNATCSVSVTDLRARLKAAEERASALAAALTRLLEASSIAESDCAYSQNEQDAAHEQARSALAQAEGDTTASETMLIRLTPTNTKC